MIAFAALAGVRIWSQDRHDWWTVGLVGATVAVIVGFVVAAGLAASSRRKRSARFVVTRDGFAVWPTVPPGLVAALLTCLLGLQVDMLVYAWRDVTDLESGPLAMEVAFASVLSLVVVALAAVTAIVVSFAWQGFAVELTRAGIWSRAPFHQRLIPWQAIALGGPPHPQLNAKRLQLVVERPELVVQRGWDAMSGTRQRPTLPVDIHAWFLAGAIRWYVEHPADRAAIGTCVEHNRLVAELTAGAQFATEPEPVPPPTTTPSTTAAATRPVRPRHVGTATALVYVTVAVALLAAAADLVIAIVFRENLLAAERAIADNIPPLPPPDGQADGTLITFSTDTAAFATGWATAAMIGTSFVALVAIVLARTMSRGSDRARVGLAVLSGVTAMLAICPCPWPATRLSAEPAAGTVLNVWSVVRTLEGLAVAGLAVAVLVVLLSAEVVAYSRRSP